MRQIIRLTESQLNKVIKKSVLKILEGYHRGIGEFFVLKQLNRPINFFNSRSYKALGR